jgi:3-oxoadipate enol-lactonase
VPDRYIDPGLTLHYEDDDYADPWRGHDTVVLLHGFAESSAAWFAWVPHLTRRLRVLRPDLRGFGRSTVPDRAESYPWSIPGFARDVVAWLDALEVDRVHLVGARVGAPIGMQIAADQPARVQSLSLVSGLARGTDVRGLDAGPAVVSLDSFAERIRQDGLVAWFASTGRARLGSSAEPAQIDFWNQLMARSDEGVCIGMMRAAAQLDISDVLGHIAAPTLVIASEGSRVQSIDATREWQRRIARSELLVLPGDSPHLAATDPDECAARVLSFIARADGLPSSSSGAGEAIRLAASGSG